MLCEYFPSFPSRVPMSFAYVYPTGYGQDPTYEGTSLASTSNAQYGSGQQSPRVQYASSSAPSLGSAGKWYRGTAGIL